MIGIANEVISFDDGGILPLQSLKLMKLKYCTEKMLSEVFIPHLIRKNFVKMDRSGLFNDQTKIYV